jgi:hypothetical protein
VTARGLFWGRQEVVTVEELRAFLAPFEGSRRVQVVLVESVGWDGLVVSGDPEPEERPTGR